MSTPPRHTLIAIDPGASGAIVAQPGDGRPLQVLRMPATPGDILDTLRDLMAGADEGTVYLEKVGGFVAGKGRTGSSMFQFGQGYGFLQGVCMAYRLELHLIRPQAWMKALGLGTRGERTDAQWKNHLKAEAQRLYPEQKVTLCTADALLLFRYAARQEQVLGGSHDRGRTEGD